MRAITTVATFDLPGDFQSSRAAKQWLRERGFSYGSSQADGLQAVWHGDHTIPKWRNLSAAERRTMDAAVHSGRNGKATITLLASASPAARAAFGPAPASDLPDTEGGSCD